MDDAIRSSFSMERIGCAIAFSTSMPLARASTRARSRSDTMSWSRSCGESSRRNKNAIEDDAEADEARDDELVLPGRQVASVWVATRLAARAPMVGPSAQNPMATPRPIWGEKSRMSAGVETRMTPSTNPITQ